MEELNFQNRYGSTIRKSNIKAPRASNISATSNRNSAILEEDHDHEL